MNKIKIKIKSKNINLFIKKIKSLKINIYKIEYIKYDIVYITINKKDYEKIMDLNKLYKIDVIKLYGIDKYKYLIKKYKYIVVSIIISFLFIFFLANLIIEVKIIHNDNNIRNLLLNELINYDIKPLSFKKNYRYIEKVKKKILKKYKNKLEWIEIENSGTKYIVRVEERRKNKNATIKAPRNIIAKKDAIIKKINAEKGEIIKNKLDYVKKGDIIITGSINLNEEIKGNVSAQGSVYGEVWYKSIVEYPLIYKEKKILNDEKNIYVLRFNNLLFNLNNIKYYDIIIKNRTIVHHKFLPIELIKQTKKKVLYIDKKLSIDEAIKKAIHEVKMKIKSKLNDKEHIISTKKLKVEENNSKIIVEIFTSVYEDITEYEIIKGESNDRNNNEKHN